MQRKYWPAVLSAIVVIALTLGYFGGILLVIRGHVVDSVVVQVIIATVGLIGIAGVGWALISRILELKGGQEDDIGKY